ncbi:hypothetical protein MKW98_026256, partial [Papaver atlanticum]
MAGITNATGGIAGCSRDLQGLWNFAVGGGVGDEEKKWNCRWLVSFVKGMESWDMDNGENIVVAGKRKKEGLMWLKIICTSVRNLPVMSMSVCILTKLLK